MSALWATVAGAQKPNVTISEQNNPARESGFNVVSGPEGSFRVSRSPVDHTSLTVTYSVSGTATPGVDYVELSGTVTLGPGIGAAIVGVDIKNDDLTERDETVIVSLRSSKSYDIPPVHSVTIEVIDIDQKIRVTRIDTLASEPGNDNATMTLERLGTLTGDLTLGLSYTGSAALGSDFTAPSSIVIPNGDSIVTLTITPLSDGQAEGSETVSLNVAAATIGVRHVTIADAVATVATSPASVIEAQGNTANFTITRTGNLSQSLTVPFTISGSAVNGTDYNTIGSSVVIATGASSATVPIVVRSDATQEGAETVILTLGSSPKHGTGVPNSATLLIEDNVPPHVATLALAASTVIGGSSTSGTLTLNGPAPAGGIAVTLTSSSTAATLQPTSITIAAGQSSGTFAINTTPRSTDAVTSISAVAPTGNAQTQSLTVQAAILSVASLNKTTVTPQAATDTTSVTGTVSLTGPAPSGGTSIQLSSSNAAAAAVPGSVVVAANQTTATFKVTVVPRTADATATITATRGAVSKTLNLTVKTPTVAALTLDPTSLAGGTSPNLRTSNATFTLDGPIPAAGVTATFTDNSDKLTENPTSLFLPGGTTSGAFSVNAAPVTTSTTGTVTASLPASSRNASLTIVPPTPISVTFNAPNVIGGQVATAQINLNGNAPVEGFSVPVSSNSGAATPCTNVPITSVSFTNNFLSKSFSVCTQPVASNTVVTITAGQGASAVSAQLEVRANTVAASAVVLTTTDIIAGNNLNGTVTLTEPAQSPNGSQITISSNNSSAVKFKPQGAGGSFTSTLQLTVPAGQTSTGFNVSTSPVGRDTLVTVSASPGAASQGLMVRASVLSAVALNPTTVQGGSTSTGQVSVTGDAPSGGFAVQLASNSPRATVPSIVTIPAGAQGASFTIATTAGQADTTAVITATLGTNQRTATLAIAGPVAVSSLSVSPSFVVAGTPTTLTVTLNNPAPSGGAVVSFSCNSPNVTVPATVTVPAGQTTTTISVNTVVFGANTNAVATITGVLGGVTRTTQLTLSPLEISILSFNPSQPTGGSTAIGTVQLDRVAPGTGITVTLSSADPSVTVPASVTVAGGQSTATFNATTVPVVTNTQVGLSATFQQSVRSGSLTVRAPDVASIAFSPNHVVGGNTSTGTVTVTGPPAAGGQAVNLASSLPGVFPVPASVTVPAGQSSTTFSVQTSTDASSGTVSVLASRAGSGGSVAGTVQVQAPSVATVALNPTSIRGGASVVGTVTLPSPALFSFALPLSSNNAAASVPATVVINSGQIVGTFTITTTAVAANTTATITAGAGSGATTTTLTITP